MPRTMTKDEALAVWRVLVAHCRKREDDHERYSFITYMTSPDPPHEYRFGGALGFGGKFWINHRDDTRPDWYVTCYQEDETPETLAMIARANERLAVLWAARLSGEGDR